MAFCIGCGAELLDGANFCSSCGAPVAQPAAAQPVEEVTAPVALTTIENTTSIELPQNDIEQEDIAENSASTTIPASGDKVWGMKWFKFVVYFQLWASMLLSVTYALYCFNQGGVIMSIVGLYYVAVVVMSFRAQRALVKFKKDGPAKYLHVLLLSIAGATLALILSVMLDMDFSDIGGLIVLIALYFANKTYFEHRAFMFIY